MSDQTDMPQRDVIDLSGTAAAAPEPAEKPERKDPDLPPAEIERITHDVIAALKTVHDPEIPSDIYELGLIYQVDLEAEGLLKVEMTLTAPGCPVAGEMPVMVADALDGVPGIGEIEVTLTFEPPWTPEMMSEDARLALGF